LKTLRREISDPKIKEHRGRIVNTTGDGLLSEFASVVDAVRCAVEVQREMAARNAAVLPSVAGPAQGGTSLGLAINHPRPEPIAHLVQPTADPDPAGTDETDARGHFDQPKHHKGESSRLKRCKNNRV
jgi:hypothetical protein